MDLCCWRLAIPALLPAKRLAPLERAWAVLAAVALAPRVLLLALVLARQTLCPPTTRQDMAAEAALLCPPILLVVVLFIIIVVVVVVVCPWSLPHSRKAAIKSWVSRRSSSSCVVWIFFSLLLEVK